MMQIPIVNDVTRKENYLLISFLKVNAKTFNKIKPDGIDLSTILQEIQRRQKNMLNDIMEIELTQSQVWKIV